MAAIKNPSKIAMKMSEKTGINVSPSMVTKVSPNVLTVGKLNVYAAQSGNKTILCWASETGDLVVRVTEW